MADNENEITPIVKDLERQGYRVLKLNKMATKDAYDLYETIVIHNLKMRGREDLIEIYRKALNMKRRGYSAKEIHRELNLLNMKYERINGSRRCIVCGLPLENCLCDMIHEAGD
ncbi:MAG: hypothetical protein H3Z54_06500 [archaeon]|nr:hypothetical protein [archaeon]MCP8316195.1 hypothetical protein [archaeon]